MTRTVWTLAWLLLFISANSGRCYVRIAIDRRYAGCQRLGILGHELRHAVEIADAASVRDNASLASLYRQIGFRTGQDREDRFDSEAAIDAGHQVEREVVAFAARSSRS